MKKKWKIAALGDVCQVIGGGTPSKNCQEYYIGNIPWATVRDMQSDVISETECKITKEAVKNSSTNIIPGGNVVIATRVGLGKVCLLEKDTAINQDLRGLIPVKPNSLSTRFLFLWLKSIAHKIIDEGTGATVQGVKLPFVKSLQIPLPPLPEQRRIVGILNEAFDAIAKAKANAEKNLQNARELFESHLNEVFTKRGEGWVEKRLGDIAESISTGPFGTMLHKSDYVDDGIPLVNPMNIIESKIIPSSKMMVNETTRNRLLVYTLKRGDVVIARRGELGRCAVVTEREEGWLCGTGSFFVRLKETMSGEYFVTLFSSKPVRERLEESSVGTTMSNLNHGILNELILPLPPLKEQHKIMSTVHKLLFETQHLESIYKRKLTALEELKKSLLHQAFNGEFTRDN